MSHNDHFIAPTRWPIIGSCALFFVMTGAVNWLHDNAIGPYLFYAGFGILFAMMFGWFREVIHENLTKFRTDPMINRSYRWGMVWFILSEVMFFATFFGALFYLRTVSVPFLNGADPHVMTHFLLWPGYMAHWPVLHNPDPSQFVAPSSVMAPWGIPAINTLLLLTSGVTITVAHWGLLKQKRRQALIFQLLTVLLGVAFLVMQTHEYIEAYEQLGLTLGSGVYGSTFFILTGFHGLHVTVGTTMLIIIWFRIWNGHFSADHHFAFEAVAWYWHFVDVVWLLLFVFVYWL